VLRNAGYSVVGPAVGNFVYIDVEQDGQTFFEALLKEGVIVRPLAGFGAPEAVRITVGTSDEHAFLAAALARMTKREPLPETLPAG
jgi:histidinol-phosphate aminotransferase